MEDKTRMIIDITQEFIKMLDEYQKEALVYNLRFEDENGNATKYSIPAIDVPSDLENKTKMANNMVDKIKYDFSKWIHKNNKILSHPVKIESWYDVVWLEATLIVVWATEQEDILKEEE